MRLPSDPRGECWASQQWHPAADDVPKLQLPNRLRPWFRKVTLEECSQFSFSLPTIPAVRGVTLMVALPWHNPIEVLMTAPRVCILRAPGTNCDVETAYAFDLAGGRAERVHLFRLLEDPSLLKSFQVLCIPGGFSYGDDVGAGVVFASQLQGLLSAAIGEFLQEDKLVLGICNGFQVLLKSRILPGGCDAWPPDLAQSPEATLTWNDNGRYTALWVHLATSATHNVFLQGIDALELPIAHAEGRLVPQERGRVADWRQRGQIALTYVGSDGASSDSGCDDEVLHYPVNPNGSTANIAGLGDPTGRVLGLMPHPERYLHATQHPQWTRRGLRGEGCGLHLFRNAVNYFT